MLLGPPLERGEKGKERAKKAGKGFRKGCHPLSPQFVAPPYAAAECTKMARFSAVAVAMFTAPRKDRAIFRPQDARFPKDQKSLANGDFLCDQNIDSKWAKLIPIAGMRYLSLR